MGKREGDEEELIITSRAMLECCRIYTQFVSEGKGAPAIPAEALLVGLGT